MKLAFYVGMPVYTFCEKFEWKFLSKQVGVMGRARNSHPIDLERHQFKPRQVLFAKLTHCKIFNSQVGSLEQGCTVWCPPVESLKLVSPIEKNRNLGCNKYKVQVHSSQIETPVKNSHSSKKGTYVDPVF